MNNAKRNFVTLSMTRSYELAARDKATMILNRDTAAVNFLHKKWHQWTHSHCKRQEIINSHQNKKKASPLQRTRKQSTRCMRQSNNVFTARDSRQQKTRKKSALFKVHHMSAFKTTATGVLLFNCQQDASIARDNIGNTCCWQDNDTLTGRQGRNAWCCKVDNICC